jgi:hypothetical protein
MNDIGHLDDRRRLGRSFRSPARLGVLQGLQHLDIDHLGLRFEGRHGRCSL